MSYFRRKYIPLSSALSRFTVLFGMGRGGSNSLWSSGNRVDLLRSHRRATAVKRSNRKKQRLRVTQRSWLHSRLDSLRRQHGYRIKPHGQLVSVSLTRYRASTPDLSTSWSWTTLQGGLASGKTNLQASFPLRCFQRLSLPHIATRRCHWRDNRYTRGASTPVLSY
jgi:hypothetical protein